MTRSIEDMIAQWEMIARHASTYSLTLDDWLNDLDLRDIIARQLAAAPLAEGNDIRSRLEAADRIFRDGTREAERSLWGPAGASHSVNREWWYFRYPSLPGGSMRRDLESAGVLRTMR